MDLEVEMDRFLKIKTNGRDDTNSNFINYPYEATPYVVLQALANSGYISKKDKIIDFGCGKGRVSFFLAYLTKAKIIGIEYDERLYERALENHKRCIYSNKVELVNCNAKDYIIPLDVTGLYFFNPFSVEILKDVLENARQSKIDNGHDIKLFFYYISSEFTKLLEDEKIELIDTIECYDYFDVFNEREVIKIYKI